MNAQDTHRGQIAPISGETSRPLWSVMIPTYNCAEYLQETLSSVLAQDPGPDVMQIEVVDDCSTQDDPKAVVEALGKGRVQFYQHPQNVGHVKNFNTCLQRSRGQLIHLLHGDDYVLDGFYHKMQHAFDHRPKPGAAFCRHIFMDEQNQWQVYSPLLQPESGLLEQWLERIVVQQHIQTPSIVVQREVYEKLGGFDHRFKFYYEDWEMWVRIATSYPVWYETQPLAAYRLRSTSNSGVSIKTGENIRDLRKGLDIAASYLPDYLAKETIDKLLARNREYSAICALKTADQLIAIDDYRAGMTQIWEALQCSQSWKVLKALLKVAWHSGVRQFSKSISTLKSLQINS